jgi:hypothetical protein
MPEIITHPDRPSEYLHGGVIAIDNRGTPTTTLTVDLRWIKGDGLSQSNYLNRCLTFDPANEADMQAYAVIRSKVVAELMALHAELQAEKNNREGVTE